MLRTTITVVEEVSALVRVAGNYVESSSSEDTAKSNEASYEDDTEENEDPARKEKTVLQSNVSVRHEKNKIATDASMIGSPMKPVLKSCLKNGHKKAVVTAIE